MVQLVVVNQKNKKGGRRNSGHGGDGDGHDSDGSMGSEADDQVSEMREMGGGDVQKRTLTIAPSFKLLSLGELRSHMDTPPVSEAEEKQRGASPIQAKKSGVGQPPPGVQGCCVSRHNRLPQGDQWSDSSKEAQKHPSWPARDGDSTWHP
jgi:hypothetical protein